MSKNGFENLIEQNEEKLIEDWLKIQSQSLANKRGLVSEAAMKANSHDFVLALRQALSKDSSGNTSGPEWSGMRDQLSSLSRDRAMQGFTPSETATFVLSFKQALFDSIRQHYQQQPEVLAVETWKASELLDKLGVFTMEAFLKTREAIISRQQQEMLELSTPVVELWQGILALPLIGTLDSARTQVVMQNLLEAIVAKGSTLAIIDITGVPTVDTLVAQHLLKTVSAARLMGAECLISGIRPQIAQTIIHLGVDLGKVITKATLADAFRVALNRLNLVVTRKPQT